METATIRFSDGTELQVEVNGTCFIAEEEPEFPEDLSEVEIETADSVTVIENAKIIEASGGFEPGYWFTIAQKSALEIQAEELARQRADIDYISAMTDVDL